MKNAKVSSLNLSVDLSYTCTMTLHVILLSNCYTTRIIYNIRKLKQQLVPWKQCYSQFCPQSVRQQLLDLVPHLHINNIHLNKWLQNLTSKTPTPKELTSKISQHLKHLLLKAKKYYLKQEFSYHKQIECQLRTQYAQNI